MKVHTNKSMGEETASTCCSTETENIQSADPCCEQPSDGSSCCDKTASQEENSKTTGCC